MSFVPIAGMSQPVGASTSQGFETINFSDLREIFPNCASNDPWLPGPGAMAVQDNNVEFLLSPPALELSELRDLHSSPESLGQQLFGFGNASVPSEDSLPSLYSELEPFEYVIGTATVFDDLDVPSALLGAEPGDPQYFAEVQREDENAATGTAAHGFESSPMEVVAIPSPAPPPFSAGQATARVGKSLPKKIYKYQVEDENAATGTAGITAHGFESSPMEVVAIPSPAPSPFSADQAAARVGKSLPKKIYKHQMDPEKIDDPAEKASVKQAIKAKAWRDKLKRKTENVECDHFIQLAPHQDWITDVIAKLDKILKAKKYSEEEKKRMMKELYAKLLPEARELFAAQDKDKI